MKLVNGIRPWPLGCFVLLFVQVIAQVDAKPFFDINPSDHRSVRKDFLKIHKEFSSVTCTSGADTKYEELYRDFRGGGEFIPVLDQRKKMDLQTVKDHLHYFVRKKKWMTAMIRNVGSRSNFEDVFAQIEIVRDDINEYLNYHKNYLESDKKNERLVWSIKRRDQFKHFKKSFYDLMDMIPFLKSFEFPVDYLELRKRYDELSGVDERRANQVYFYRKLVEDGAQDENHRRSDSFLRTTLSSVYLKVGKAKFLDEDLRYDLNDTLTSLEYLLSRGKDKQLERLNEWLARVQKQEIFYLNLLKLGQKERSEILEHQRVARYELSDYVLKKQEEVYTFWMKQSELNQALFVLESILYNEVGEVDGADALERKDVAQVVLNRRSHPWYGKLSSKDRFFGAHQNIKMRKSLEKYPWLNVLFKNGEFSFTYYFIHASVHTFCPDMSKRGQKIRKRNLLIALDVLQNPNKHFKAERYFSRASMTGRIDMTSIWDDFIPYPERPGRPISFDERLRKKYLENQYLYYYYFKDPNGRYFKVINIDDQNYVVPFKGIQFYTYRNRHYFRYFIKRP